MRAEWKRNMQKLKKNHLYPIKVKKRKSSGKTSFKRGGAGKSFDTRGKYERGSLKYGRRPGSETDRDDDRARSFVQKRRFKKVEKDVHKIRFVLINILLTPEFAAGEKQMI